MQVWILTPHHFWCGVWWSYTWSEPNYDSQKNLLLLILHFSDSFLFVSYAWMKLLFLLFLCVCGHSGLVWRLECNSHVMWNHNSLYIWTPSCIQPVVEVNWSYYCGKTEQSIFPFTFTTEIVLAWDGCEEQGGNTQHTAKASGPISKQQKLDSNRISEWGVVSCCRRAEEEELAS